MILEFKKLLYLKTIKKFIILFSVILIFSIGITYTFSLQYFESLVHDSEIEIMKRILDKKSQEIDSLHVSASQELITILQNPLFVEYFELPETKTGNV